MWLFPNSVLSYICKWIFLLKGFAIPIITRQVFLCINYYAWFWIFKESKNAISKTVCLINVLPILYSLNVIWMLYCNVLCRESFSQMDKQWCKMIILELTDLVRMYSHNAKAPLALLHSITSNYCNKVSPFVTLIMVNII